MSPWARDERLLLQKIREVSEPVSSELRSCMADDALACVAVGAEGDAALNGCGGQEGEEVVAWPGDANQNLTHLGAKN